MAEFVTPDIVRAYLQANEQATGQWSDSLIGSNIAAASANLQRWTNRQFEPQGSNAAVKKVFTTNGRDYLVLPDFQTLTTVTLNGATLELDVSYYRVPDRLNTGVYVGIEFPNRIDYLTSSEWWDRGYDSRLFQNRLRRGLPDDLICWGHWGHAVYPAELQHAATVLAAYYTLRVDAVLSGSAARLDAGVVLDYSGLPREVRDFIAAWRLGDPMVTY